MDRGREGDKRIGVAAKLSSQLDRIIQTFESSVSAQDPTSITACVAKLKDLPGLEHGRLLMERHCLSLPLIMGPSSASCLLLTKYTDYFKQSKDKQIKNSSSDHKRIYITKLPLDSKGIPKSLHERLTSDVPYYHNCLWASSTSSCKQKPTNFGRLCLQQPEIHPSATIFFNFRTSFHLIQCLFRFGPEYCNRAQ
ncbi:hypothetical protein JHK82_022623 [Glycine max]|nr:hypothetical protein JHK82_022623 [Glycine max]